MGGMHGSHPLAVACYAMLQALKKKGFEPPTATGGGGGDALDTPREVEASEADKRTEEVCLPACLLQHIHVNVDSSYGTVHAAAVTQSVGYGVG
jgi:hypothetical protein